MIKEYMQIVEIHSEAFLDKLIDREIAYDLSGEDYFKDIYDGIRENSINESDYSDQYLSDDYDHFLNGKFDARSLTVGDYVIVNIFDLPVTYRVEISCVCDKCNKNISILLSSALVSNSHLCNKCRFVKILDVLHENGRIPISYQQRYISELLNGELNVRMSNFFADILDAKNNVVIEYDGSGHYLSVYRGSITMEEKIQYDKDRDSVLIDMGYRVLRVISCKDLFPSDDIFMEIYNNFLESSDKRVVVNLGEDKTHEEYGKMRYLKR